MSGEGAVWVGWVVPVGFILENAEWATYQKVRILLALGHNTPEHADGHEPREPVGAHGGGV